jgi:hypothetical protein
MVGPPSEDELCLETMKIMLQWLMVGEPCETVPVGFSSSQGDSFADERFGAGSGLGSPGLPVRLWLEGARWECKTEEVLCE